MRFSDRILIGLEGSSSILVASTKLPNYQSCPSWGAGHQTSSVSTCSFEDPDCGLTLRTATVWPNYARHHLLTPLYVSSPSDPSMRDNTFCPIYAFYHLLTQLCVSPPSDPIMRFIIFWPNYAFHHLLTQLCNSSPSDPIMRFITFCPNYAFHHLLSQFCVSSPH